MSDINNPDVRKAKVLERSTIRTVITFVGGALIERVVAYLTGFEAPWAPYAAAALKAVWDVFRGPPSYRATDTDAPNVVIRP